MNLQVIPCVILCGGKSSRMGADKALLEFGKNNLAQFLFDKFSSYFKRVHMCAKTQKISNLPFIIEPDSEIFSPLVGIKAAFENLDSEMIAFVSVDTPFVDICHYEKLFCAIFQSSAQVAYIKQILDSETSESKEHFLLSIWHKSSLGAIKNALDSQNYRMRDLIHDLDSVSVEIFDEKLNFNLNKPQDYKIALSFLQKA